MNKQILKFSEASLPLLNELFGLSEDFDAQLPKLFEWKTEADKVVLSEGESEQIQVLQKAVKRAGRSWNETELETKLIGPLFLFSGIEDTKIGYFLERPLVATIGDIEISGTVDGLIARGVQEPKVPYFCLHEYKKNAEYRGSPEGQVLAAMLAAQAMNDADKPVYGLFVTGLSWNFLVLDGQQYAIGQTYSADSDNLFTILKMLKALKTVIKNNF